MRIALLGNNVVDYCSEVQYQRTLEAMGHSVDFIVENKTLTEEILSRAVQADLFLWVHSHGFENRGMYSMATVLEILKEQRVPTVGYHLDLYMGLQRWQEYTHHDYFKVEYFFTVDKLMADWLNENTQTKGYFLEAGVFGKECVALPKERVKYDIVFVGSKRYHPEWPYRPQLVNWLEENYGKRFVHVGPDGAGIRRGLQLNQVLSNAKITVGDSLNIGFDYPYYSSDRFFEITGRGGFLIYPKIEGFAPEYQNNKHVAYYKHGDLEDLREKIDYFLSHPEKREQIRKAGFELTKTKNTYTQRFQTIIDTINANQ